MYLGIDSSNYTTSVAVLNEDLSYSNIKQVLKVKTGERGLRQSDAFYQHINNFPELINRLDFSDVNAIGVSSKPTNDIESYMPCFNAGVRIAEILSEVLKVKLFTFSHQNGHIASALLSSNQFELINKQFIAFHVSGGTTQALLVEPDDEFVFKTTLLSSSLDLKAGQVIDRTGVKLGLDFPCGQAVEKSALNCTDEIKVTIPFRNGNPSLSGIENKVNKLIEDGADNEYICKFVIECIKLTVYKMCSYILKDNNLPIVFSGGVMSNSIIRNFMQDKFNCYFAEPELSRDNAVGIAFLTKYLSEK